jgi:hypothetical protein
VSAARGFKLLDLKTAKKTKSSAEYNALKADMSALACLVCPYIPKETGKPRKIENWNAVNDLQSDLKTAMGDVILKAFPEPSAARDDMLKGIGLHKCHKLFLSLFEKDADYPGPPPPKQSGDGKEKNATGKKRKAKGDKKDGDDDNEDEEPMNAGPTSKRISRKTPVAQAASKKLTSRRAAVQAPAANTHSGESDADAEAAASDDEANVAQSAEEDSPLPDAMSALQVAEDPPNDVDMVDADVTAIYSPQDNIMSEATTTSASAADIDVATPESAVPPGVALESAPVPAAPAIAPAVAPAVAPAATLPARTIDIQAFWTVAANRFANSANVPLEDALELFMQHIDVDGNPSEHSFDIISRLIVNATSADWNQLRVLWRQRQNNA